MRRLLAVTAVLAVAVLVVPSVQAGKHVIFDDRNAVFVGHPASFTGVCPEAQLADQLPYTGCQRTYRFSVPETDDGTGDNSVEIEVEYDTGPHFADDPCVKTADLDLFLYAPDGNLLDKDTGCDAGRLVVGGNDLPSGNYVVEVRGNWGAVVDYHAKGVLAY